MILLLLLLLLLLFAYGFSVTIRRTGMCLLCSEFEIVAHCLFILSLKKNVWLSLHDWIWRDTIFFYHAMHLLPVLARTTRK